MQRMYLLMIPILFLFFTGCGIKEQIKESATGIEKSLLASEQNIEKSKEDFLNSEDAKSMEFYVKKEQLVNSFDNSQKLVVEAKKVLVLIKELIKKDDSNDSDKVLVYISNIRNYISEINKSGDIKIMASDINKSKDDVYTDFQNLTIYWPFSSIIQFNLIFLE